MALRVLNQISSIKYIQTGSVRSESTEKSCSVSPLVNTIKNNNTVLKHIANSRHRRSISQPPTCVSNSKYIYCKSGRYDSDNLSENNNLNSPYFKNKSQLEDTPDVSALLSGVTYSGTNLSRNTHYGGIMNPKIVNRLSNFVVSKKAYSSVAAVDIVEDDTNEKIIKQKLVNIAMGPIKPGDVDKVIDLLNTLKTKLSILQEIRNTEKPKKVQTRKRFKYVTPQNKMEQTVNLARKTTPTEVTTKKSVPWPSYSDKLKIIKEEAENNASSESNPPRKRQNRQFSTYMQKPEPEKPNENLILLKKLKKHQKHQRQLGDLGQRNANKNTVLNKWLGSYLNDSPKPDLESRTEPGHTDVEEDTGAVRKVVIAKKKSEPDKPVVDDISDETFIAVKKPVKGTRVAFVKCKQFTDGFGRTVESQLEPNKINKIKHCLKSKYLYEPTGLANNNTVGAKARKFSSIGSKLSTDALTSCKAANNRISKAKPSELITEELETEDKKKFQVFNVPSTYVTKEEIPNEIDTRLDNSIDLTSIMRNAAKDDVRYSKMYKVQPVRFDKHSTINYFKPLISTLKDYGNMFSLSPRFSSTTEIRDEGSTVSKKVECKKPEVSEKVESKTPEVLQVSEKVECKKTVPNATTATNVPKSITVEPPSKDKSNTTTVDDLVFLEEVDIKPIILNRMVYEKIANYYKKKKGSKDSGVDRIKRSIESVPLKAVENDAPNDVSNDVPNDIFMDADRPTWRTYPTSATVALCKQMQDANIRFITCKKNNTNKLLLREDKLPQSTDIPKYISYDNNGIFKHTELSFVPPKIDLAPISSNLERRIRLNQEMLADKILYESSLGKYRTSSFGMQRRTFSTHPIFDHAKNMSSLKQMFTREYGDAIYKGVDQSFKGICTADGEKQYRRNKDCICIQPARPTVQPKMKRLKKRYNTNKPNSYKTAECLKDHCPPRADENKDWHARKHLPDLPVGGCEILPPEPELRQIRLKRLVKRFKYPDPSCPPESECPPRADANLKTPEKFLKTLPPGPCPCVEPHQPTKTPQIKRLKKRTRTGDDPNRYKKTVCAPEPCPPRADDGLKHGRKFLPVMKFNDCPCVEPFPLKDGGKMSRLKKRFKYADPVYDCEEYCPKGMDEICGYEIKPKKLKPILPARKGSCHTKIPVPVKKCYSTSIQFRVSDMMAYNNSTNPNCLVQPKIITGSKMLLSSASQFYLDTMQKRMKNNLAATRLNSVQAQPKINRKESTEKPHERATDYSYNEENEPENLVNVVEITNSNVGTLVGVRNEDALKNVDTHSNNNNNNNNNKTGIIKAWKRMVCYFKSEESIRAEDRPDAMGLDPKNASENLEQANTIYDDLSNTNIRIKSSLASYKIKPYQARQYSNGSNRKKPIYFTLDQTNDEAGEVTTKILDEIKRKLDDFNSSNRCMNNFNLTYDFEPGVTYKEKHNLIPKSSLYEKELEGRIVEAAKQYCRTVLVNQGQTYEDYVASENERTAVLRKFLDGLLKKCKEGPDKN